MPQESSSGSERREPPSLAERLAERFGPEGDRDIQLEPGGGAAAPADMPSEVLQRLAGRPDGRGRYQLQGQLAEGGMGAILRVWDADLRRPLAMKVILDPEAPDTSAPGGPGTTSREQAHRVGRFLEEALVTAQLDHPGIVPVHELGLDAEGRVYFVMKLVKGEDLKAVFARVHSGEPGWSLTRVLGLLLRACEAMAYAHSKRVIHRDLKPANVMVGRYGEVYVMDWGLARVLDRPDAKDIRLRPPTGTFTRSLRSARRDAAAAQSDSPLITMDGDIVGTPQYMPPEQARGEVERLGPTADVYSLGAMLYHLIGGWMPYVVPGTHASARAILERVQAGPPRALHELAPEAPAELVAICERAMAREPGDRYADMTALADDLRAYLEHRVVSAYETGALAELRKWVARNRGLAASLAAVLVLALTAGGLFAWLNADLQEALVRASELGSDLASKNTVLSGMNSQLTQLNTDLDVALAEAQRERANVLRLSAIQRLEGLEREADALWPATPALIPRYDDWLERAATLVAGLEPGADGSDIGHRQQLRVLRERALPRSAEEREADRLGHPAHAEWELTRAAVEKAEIGLQAQRVGLLGEASDADRQARLARIEAQLPLARQRLAELDAALDERRTFRFASEDDTWWHDELVKLVDDITAFADPQHGLLDGVSERHGWGVRVRRAFAESVEQQTLTGDDARARWALACASIADRSQCPLYDGLALAPQLGLLPIGRDPASGLWEFWHVASGSEPIRLHDGSLAPAPDDGIVLVLVPGGTFWMGAQSADPAAPGHDAQAKEEEAAVRSVQLSAYFLAKHEMTQGQWERTTGSNPSQYGRSADFSTNWNRLARPWSKLHPVEHVAWDDVERVLRWLGLCLPSEAQWEYGCRAGTTTSFWTGDAPESLAGAANLSDAYGRAHGNHSWTAFELWLDDGQTVHAPVGSYRANAFGLHDVHGNVWEWCQDTWEEYHPAEPALDPLHEVEGVDVHVVRGGSFENPASKARSAGRDGLTREVVNNWLGVRPARRIQP